MAKRILAAVLGVMGAANGAFMLGAGRQWYVTVPGVTHTGPFNPHFVADIGAAYLAAGLALAARAWRPRYWPAAAAGVAFYGMHALIHVADIAQGRSANPANDALLVVLPAVLAVWAATPSQGEQDA